MGGAVGSSPTTPRKVGIGRQKMVFNLKNYKEMKTMYLTVRVDFICPEGMDLETAQGLAESLAIQPNMVSVVNGVTLEDVEVCGINEE